MKNTSSENHRKMSSKKLQICQTNETVIQKPVYSLQSRVLEISTQHSICFIKQVRSVLQKKAVG